ncbi:MAG: glucose-1-phosphate thymidylyltransferase [Spirochaetota bacterium]
MKEKIQKILIDETIVPDGLAVNTKVFSFSEIRNGILTPLERLLTNYPDAELFYKHNDEYFQKAFLSRNPVCKAYIETKFDLVVKPTLNPWEMLSQVFKMIEDDLSIWKELKKWKSKLKPKNNGVYIIGKKKGLHIHPSVKIDPGVVLNVDTGPIVIDKDTQISPFSYLEGPLYIGKNSSIDNARITGGCIFGQHCKIGGEVENSIFGNFSNKHHEGFVGHSYVGNWVNLGAMAATSDLKNNYSYVKLKLKDKVLNTETIKFGSVIGDFVKISIGCMINTGSTIEVGANVVSQSVSGHTPPFIWINSETKYRLDHFIDNTKKVMARRDKKLRSEEEALIRHIYEL